MVRNTKGGKGSKAFARKFVSDVKPDHIRSPDSPLELFAVVQKMFGPMCEVFTNDGRTFKCHIRGKFKGRNKRFSIISVGSLVIIGLRDFEAPNFINSDLLEVFSHDQISSIQKTHNISSLTDKILSLNNSSGTNVHGSENILFDINTITIPPQAIPTYTNNDNHIENNDFDFDFDDI
jgi:translation initiation factor IF-1